MTRSGGIADIGQHSEMSAYDPQYAIDRPSIFKHARIGRAPACGFLLLGVRAGVRYAANTIEEMQKLLRGYRDNMRVEIEAGIAVAASTVAELRALPTWPNGSVLNIHIDLDPRFSVVRVERAS